MNLSRLPALSLQQVLIGASVGIGLLLLVIQFWAFTVFPKNGGARIPNEVSAARGKLQNLTAAREAIAKRGVVDVAAIPQRDFTPVAPEHQEALAEVETADSVEPEAAGGVAPATAGIVEVVEVVPQLKGIAQIRDVSGQIRLRAAYPQGILAEGALVDGYRIRTISVDQVVLVKNGKELVQRVGKGASGRTL